MPSYSRTVKDELARIFDEEEEYQRAELAAMLKVGAVFTNGRMEFSTLSAAVARKLIKLLNKFYPAAKREVAAVRLKSKAKIVRYFVRIFLTGVTEKFFEEIDSPEIVSDDFAKVAYLRGAFAACGTVNKPEAQYYLDISTLSESAAIFLNQLFKDLDFRPTFYVRKEFFVNYLCEGDAVEEFLGMVGATETLERFQITRNLKEVRANVNRLVNCETANLNKSVATAQRQIADIKILLENKVKVDDELKRAMNMRLKHPDFTIKEMAEKLFMTRQALSYRLKKIHELAEETKIRLEKNPTA
ncbi:MAG: DNA-binding protein WhiA [Selenomonadaceae bacterium]|nr:DNA-binding protein WhiA [Selenomonadaceae bacterium]